MLKKDGIVFVRIPLTEEKPNQRSLRPGLVIRADEETCEILLSEPIEIKGLEESPDGYVHFDKDRKFVQQSVRITRVENETSPLFAVQFQGTPVSAELRQCYRVTCIGSNIKIAVGTEIDCELVDLSATGIAFYSRKEYRVGQLLKLMLVYQGTVYNGHGTIQSTRRMQPKTWRYGVHCTDRGQDTLARSLASINFAIQAEQRRRLSRT